MRHRFCSIEGEDRENILPLLVIETKLIDRGTIATKDFLKVVNVVESEIFSY